jgi:hypothetical protein
MEQKGLGEDADEMKVIDFDIQYWRTNEMYLRDCPSELLNVINVLREYGWYRS